MRRRHAVHAPAHPPRGVLQQPPESLCSRCPPCRRHYEQLERSTAGLHDDALRGPPAQGRSRSSCAEELWCESPFCAGSPARGTAATVPLGHPSSMCCRSTRDRCQTPTAPAGEQGRASCVPDPAGNHREHRRTGRSPFRVGVGSAAGQPNSRPQITRASQAHVRSSSFVPALAIPRVLRHPASRDQ